MVIILERLLEVGLGEGLLCRADASDTTTIDAFIDETLLVDASKGEHSLGIRILTLLVKSHRFLLTSSRSESKEVGVGLNTHLLCQLLLGL